MEITENQEIIKMPNVNRVILIGNVTRDIEVKNTPTGKAVADFSLAINRVWRDQAGDKQEETTFIDVQLWGRSAEIAHQYLKKGSPVFIEGRLKVDTWDDKETGQKRSRLRVVGDNMQLLGGKSSGDSSNEYNQEPKSNHRSSAPAPSKTRPSRDPDLDQEPNDIPFRSTIRRDGRNCRLNRKVM